MKVDTGSAVNAEDGGITEGGRERKILKKQVLS